MTNRTAERLPAADEPEGLDQAEPAGSASLPRGTESSRMGTHRPTEDSRSEVEPTDAVQAEVHSLQARSGLGLWALAIFAAMSLWARMDFPYFPEIPEGWHEWLGAPPPLNWIHGIYLLYIFSALVLSLTRMAEDWHPFTGFRHLGYLASFYGFYNISGGLEDTFWAVLVGGFSVLGLEGYRNLLQCRQRIRKLTSDRS